MIGWETLLAAYLTGSLVAALLLGRHLAAVRRRYPLVDDRGIQAKGDGAE